MIPNSWWYKGFVGLVVVASLPFIGHLIRGDRGNRCDWDGLAIEPIYQVRFVEQLGDSYHFCCLQCAERWWERRGTSSVQVFVTDEKSGQELRASEAYYVRSVISTNDVTGNRQHVFRDEADAVKHAQAARGRQLLGDERPFSNIELKGLDQP
jgi:hypothetical protein